MRDAVILTGQIRIDSEAQRARWNELKRECQNYDVYVCTYEAYKERAYEISNKVVIFEDQSVNSVEYLKLPPSNIPNDINQRKGNNHMWQHIHLRKLVETYHHELAKYKYIVKIRNDVMFSIDEIVKCLESNEGFVCAKTDMIFGSDATLFLKMFYTNNFIDYIKRVWNHDKDYISLNYGNLLKTMTEGSPLWLKWSWLNYQNIDGSVNMNSVRKLCTKNSLFKPRLDQIKVVNVPTKTGKPFFTAFASEKQLAIYFLFFAPVVEVPGSGGLIR